MIENNLRIVCTKCKGSLERYSNTAIQCQYCHLLYRTIFDIPDMRYPISESSNDPELIMAERLIAAYPNATYHDLVDIFFSTSNRPGHLLLHFKQQRHRQLLRGSQFTDMFLSRLNKYFEMPDYASVLDLGCGSGASLVALSRLYNNVIGVDPSLIQLLMARKFCEENNIMNVKLVQAYRQHLPFLENSFSYVTAQNVLEHVFEIDDVMLEVYRILKTNGCFVGDSRNRYDLFFPEPHCQLRGVGLLPRSWANFYVKWRIGLTYESFHAYLLSYGDLRNALRKAFGDNYQIMIPKASAYDMPAKWDDLIVILESIEWIRRFLVVIFPSHLAIAQK